MGFRGTFPEKSFGKKLDPAEDEQAKGYMHSSPWAHNHPADRLTTVDYHQRCYRAHGGPPKKVAIQISTHLLGN